MIVLLALTALAVPPTATQLQEMTGLGTAARSPDGRWVAFTLSTSTFDASRMPSADDEGDEHPPTEPGSDTGWTKDRQLHLLDLHTGSMRQLTHGEAHPGAPKWSADGTHLGFMRDGTLQRLPLSGGDAVPVDTGDLKPSWWTFADANSVVFAATPDAEAETERLHRALDGAYLFEEDHRNAQLYRVDLGDESVVAITDGTSHIVDAAYSAVADAWLLVTAPSSDPYEAIVDGKIELLDGGVRTVLEAEPDCPGDLAWSRDGAYASWVSCEGGPSLTNKVMVRRLSDGKQWRLGEGLELTVDRVTFSADARTVIAQVTAGTEHRLLRFPREGGAPTDIGYADGTLRGPILLDRKGKTALVQFANPTTPPSLGTLNLKTGQITTVYSPNEQVADWDLGATTVVRWKNGEGTDLAGILTRPHDASGATPLVVMPHGGPDSSSVLKFNSWGQYFAGRGYAVFNPNYRGGIGNGAEFYAANRGRMGVVEQEDIESGVDMLIAEGLADADKLYYGGWSWGGYLTAWTIGHVDRYKAAMAGAAVVDTVNQYVTSDINHGEIADWEYKGRPWKAPDSFDQSDPSRFLSEVSTPTLILHGDADNRVPFSQGLTLYRALRDQGVETAFWVYPGQSHWLASPAHNVHRLEAWADWYDDHP